MHPAPKTQFLFVKSGEIVSRRILNRIVIRNVSLDYDLPGRLSSSGATSHLRKQLKSSLGGSKIGEAETHIGPHHADERHPMNVVTLGNHLRSNQKIDLARI